MNQARETILARVRAALRAPSAAPAAPTSAAPFAAIANPDQRFREEFRAQHGELVEDLPAFLTQFNHIVADEALCGSALLGATGANVVAESRLEGRSHNLTNADLGVTGCECLVAQTGSIVVATRAISVLPPTHLVIARRDQLVPDLAAAFALLRERYLGRWPDALTFITGPSRTADIEKILVMGAHGPKRLALYWG